MIEHGDLRLYYEAQDQAFGTAAGSAAAGGSPISCHEGCSACCYQHVMVTTSEAVNIATWVLGEPEYRERVETYVEAVEAAWDTPTLVKRFKNKKPRVQQRVDIHWKFQIACPLLTNNGLCAIHDVDAMKPLKCRTHQVASPAENCAYGSAVTDIALIQPTDDVWRELRGRLQMALLEQQYVDIEKRYVQEGVGLLGVLVWRVIQALEARQEENDAGDDAEVSASESGVEGQEGNPD